MNLSRGLFLALFLGGALWVINTQLIIIDKVECYIHDQPNPEICKQLFFLKNQSLFFSDLQQTELYQDLLKNSQGQIFRPEAIERVLPQTLIVHLIKEQPQYQLFFEGQSYWVNSQNFFGQSDPSLNLPIVELSQNHSKIIKDHQIDSEFNQQVLALLAGFKQYNLNFEKIILDRQQSKLILTDQSQFVFELGQNPTKLAAQIKLISLQLDEIQQSLPSQMTEIDLRFEHPVVKTKQDQTETSSTG